MNENSVFHRDATTNGSVWRGRTRRRGDEGGAGDDGYVKLNSTLPLLNMHGIRGSKYIPWNTFAGLGVMAEVANLNDHFKRKSLILGFFYTLFPAVPLP